MSEFNRCPGSEIIIEYSSPLLAVGMPCCCPRCGALTTLVKDRGDVKPGYDFPMIPIHDQMSIYPDETYDSGNR